MGGIVKLKRCTVCKVEKKVPKDFYYSKGIIRSACRKCTIRRNLAYQKRTESWKHRFVDEAKQRSYMVDYYARNKDKFVEYRRQFKIRRPNYFRDYERDRRNRTPPKGGALGNHTD